MIVDSGKIIDILLVEDNPGDARLAREALKDSKIGNNIYHEDNPDHRGVLIDYNEIAPKMSPGSPVKVLVIEDSSGDARLVREMLRPYKEVFALDFASSLSAACNRLKDQNVDVVLLDLGLPESRGLATLAALQGRAAYLPVVVMTSVDDEAQAIEAVRQGAEDYLIKGRVDGRLLRRSLMYAIERKRLTEGLKKAQADIRDSEEKYRRIVETANEGIWVTDADGKTVFVNSHMAEMLGYTIEEMLGKSFHDFVDANQIAHAEGRRGQGREGFSERYDFQVRRKDGSQVWVMISGTPLFDSEKRFVGHLGMFTDISDRKRVDQLKDEFIGVVSHELKTPLTIVLGSLYTARSPGLTSRDKREMLEDAISGAESLTGIVENVLDLSRAEAQRLVLEKRAADLKQVASQIVGKLGHRSAIHRIVMDIPDGLPSVVIDQARVGRLLNNLIDNAIKYSPEGGDVKIFVWEEEANLVVAVRDQGVGISKENQARLFDRFQRLDRSGDSRIPGVGLGLHVCRLLAEAHGGRIWVESQPGCGSTFFFTLPVARY